MKKLILIIILGFSLIFTGGIFYITRGLNQEIKLEGIHLSNLKDGDYTGQFKQGRWTNEIKVTIKDQKITDINIIDDVTFIKAGLSEELFSRVIKEQDTKVDTVTGATMTSKAYLKSIENALKR